MSVLRLALILPLVVFARPADALDLSKGRWVDLTHAFNKDTVYWPTAKMFSKTEVFRGRTPGGWFYSAYNFAAAEHGGTHMDSPIHFADKTRSTEQVPLGQLIGPGFVIDVSRQVSRNVDHLISADDIRNFEARHGKLPAGAIVLLNTGRAPLYPNRQAYMGTDMRGLPPTGTTIIALPMKIEGGSGGPLRIIAHVPGN
jgi:kynurenine formamidase